MFFKGNTLVAALLFFIFRKMTKQEEGDKTGGKAGIKVHFQVVKLCWGNNIKTLKGNSSSSSSAGVEKRKKTTI